MHRTANPCFSFILAGCVAAIVSAIGAPRGLAQSVGLPTPRLLTTMPMGGQVGTQVDVTITGELLEDASTLLFSHPGISAIEKTDDAGAAIKHQFVVTIANDCPPGIYDARVLTPFGISSARAFSVGRLQEIVQTQASTTPESASDLPLESICNAFTTERAINHYRFHAEKGQRVIIDCGAGGIDSKLSPVLIVADAKGNDLLVQRRGDWLDFTAPQTTEYLVKVHDLTFLGGPYYFYRLSLRTLERDATPEALPVTKSVSEFSWPPVGLVAESESTETEPNNGKGKPQQISLPCDLTGNFFPAADVDRFEFTAKKGETWWIEIASERLGRPTDPAILVQRVVTTDGKDTLVDVAELSDIPSPIKRSSNSYAYDGPPYNAGSSDVLGKIEILEDGTYRLQLTDLFGGTRSDDRNVYRMLIRAAQPDFAIIAWAMHMELRNGDRNALSKPIALRPGMTIPFEVMAIRRDGFDGPIEIGLENLPDGVRADGLRIPPGQSRGHLLVTADPGAPKGHTVATFFGTAEINGNSVRREGTVASMAWPVRDHSNEIPSPRLMADVPVSVGEAEVAPLAIAAKKDEVFEVQVGQKLTIPLTQTRLGEFSGASIRMKTMGAGFEGNPEFDWKIADDSADVTLDLAALGTGPGDYSIAFYGGAVNKYVPPTSPSTEETKKVDPIDIVDIFVSKPVAIRVLAGDQK